MTVKNLFVIESFIRDSFKNTDSSINETSEVWVSHWIINTNQFFIILILKVGVLNALYFKYIYPGFHRQGLSLVLDKNVNLSCFNWKKLALTDLKIYQCLCFVSRCTPVMFFSKHVYKNCLNVLIELWSNPGLCRVHTARFSNLSDRRCFHTAWLSGVGFSRCCFHIARWIRDRGFHIARFHNRKNRWQLCLIRKYSQTHARSDKEITQDHADIMVYKSSRNTQ